MLDELADAAIEEEGFLLLAALVGDGDAQAGVEVGQLAQALGQNIVVKLGFAEDQVVGLEVDARARAGGAANGLEGPRGAAALEANDPDAAVAPGLDLGAFGECVDDTDADAVQSAGDLIGVAVELSAGAQLCQAELQGGDAVALLDTDGEAAAVVLDADAAVRFNHYGDVLAGAGHGLVDGVIDDLVDQVVQTTQAGVADVHGGAFTYVLRALQDLHAALVITLQSCVLLPLGPMPAGRPRWTVG